MDTNARVLAVASHVCRFFWFSCYRAHCAYHFVSLIRTFERLCMGKFLDYTRKHMLSLKNSRSILAEENNTELQLHSYVGNKMVTLVLQSLGCEVSAINTVNYSKKGYFLPRIRRGKRREEQSCDLGGNADV